MTTRVALYGGSFNPVHHGHLSIARSIAEALDIDQVVLLPSHAPPHKLAQGLAKTEHRMAMVRLAVTNDPLFSVSDHDATCVGPSYTVKTIEHFKSALPDDAEIVWIVGADSLLELHTWYQVAKLVANCRIVTANRPGSAIGSLDALEAMIGKEATRRLLDDVIDTPHIDISSTQIRNRVKENRSIRYFVPSNVEEYIRQHGLYAAGQTTGTS
ncbi:MAG: nicotinate (nicotinamide) nucleotide adenylyltransferase [Phycisphaerae bacterium]